MWCHTWRHFKKQKFRPWTRLIRKLQNLHISYENIMDTSFRQSFILLFRSKGRLNLISVSKISKTLNFIVLFTIRCNFYRSLHTFSEICIKFVSHFLGRLNQNCFKIMKVFPLEIFLATLNSCNNFWIYIFTVLHVNCWNLAISFYLKLQ